MSQRDTERTRRGAAGHLRFHLPGLTGAWLLLITVLRMGCAPAGPPGACKSDDECALPQRCLGTDDRFCGIPCGADRPCGAGFACVAGTSAPSCERLEDDRPVGASCTADTECASGACVGDDDAARCVGLCQEDLSCGEEERCFFVGLRTVCLSPLDDRATGESCETPRQCASGRCVALPHLGETGRCVAPCDENRSCGEPEVCVALEIGTDVCVPAADDGVPCDGPAICAGGRCVADLDGVAICTESCGEGQSCDEGWSCVADADGQAVCMPRLDTRPDGVACDVSRECASGICARFADFGTLCASACADMDACPEGQICWSSDAGGLCGPLP